MKMKMKMSRVTEIILWTFCTLCLTLRVTRFQGPRFEPDYIMLF